MTSDFSFLDDLQAVTAAAQDSTINRFFKFILMTFAFSSIWLNAIMKRILYGFLIAYPQKSGGREYSDFGFLWLKIGYF